MDLVDMVILLSLINLPSLCTSNGFSTLGFIFNPSFFNLRIIVQPLYRGRRKNGFLFPFWD